MPKGEAIVQEGFQKAATSLLHSFHIASVTDFDVYLYSNTKQEIPVEETILHILLIDRGNSHYSIYAYLLLKRELNNINESYLATKAEWFGLSNETNHLLRIAKGL